MDKKETAMSIKLPQIILISSILTGCVTTGDTVDPEVVPSNENLMSIKTATFSRFRIRRLNTDL